MQTVRIATSSLQHACSGPSDLHGRVQTLVDLCSRQGITFLSIGAFTDAAYLDVLPGVLAAAHVSCSFNLPPVAEPSLCRRVAQTILELAADTGKGPMTTTAQCIMHIMQLYATRSHLNQQGHCQRQSLKQFIAKSVAHDAHHHVHNPPPPLPQYKTLQVAWMLNPSWHAKRCTPAIGHQAAHLLLSSRTHTTAAAAVPLQMAQPTSDSVQQPTAAAASPTSLWPQQRPQHVASP